MAPITIICIIYLLLYIWLKAIKRQSKCILSLPFSLWFFILLSCCYSVSYYCFITHLFILFNTELIYYLESNDHFEEIHKFCKLAHGLITINIGYVSYCNNIWTVGVSNTFVLERALAFRHCNLGSIPSLGDK